MTDITTTSDIAGPANSPGIAATEPYIFWQGQAYSRASAGARRATLMADKAYADAARAGNVEHTQTLAALWQIENTGSAPQPPQTFGDVQAQMQDRASRETAEYAEHLRQTVNFSDQQIHEIINRRPLLDGEMRWHRQQLATLKSDREFVSRYLKGDRDAVLKMRTHMSAVALPVGTLDDVKAWEARHPLKGAA